MLCAAITVALFGAACGPGDDNSTTNNATENNMTDNAMDNQSMGAMCGDGTVDEGEECDDGNTDAGDGCDADCKTEAADNMEPGNMEPGNMEPGNMEPGNMEPGNMEPGNMEPGNMEPGNMEPGNMEPGNMEPGNMEPGAMCGDGTVDEGEECDDGNMTDGDGCSAMCLLDLCFADADYGTATLSNALADYDGSDAFGIAELNADTDLLLIELYDGFGAFANGLTTGMVTITGDEADYETCGACVLLRTDCDDNTGQGCDPATAPVYMATGGTINIIELSPNLKVDLSNVTFDHVDIDENTFASTPHRDMCTSGIVSASFDAPSVMNP